MNHIIKTRTQESEASFLKPDQNKAPSLLVDVSTLFKTESIESSNRHKHPAPTEHFGKARNKIYHMLADLSMYHVHV